MIDNQQRFKVEKSIFLTMIAPVCVCAMELHWAIIDFLIQEIAKAEVILDRLYISIYC